MRIVRGPRPERYTVLDNRVARDERLSFAARGLLAYLLSHRDGWEISAGRLEAAGPDGRRAVRSALRELETAGYLERPRGRDKGGRFSHEPWVVHDTAVPHADPWSDLQEQDVSAGRTTVPRTTCGPVVAAIQEGPKEEGPMVVRTTPAEEPQAGDGDPVRQVMARAALPPTCRRDISRAVWELGWPLDRLVSHLTDRPGDNPTATAIYRLRNIGDPPVRSFRVVSATGTGAP